MKNLSIKVKLLLLSVVSLIILSITLGVIAVEKSQTALIEKEYDKLVSARESKIKQLQGLFDLYLKQVSLLSNTSYTRDYTAYAQNVHKKLNTDSDDVFDVHHELMQKKIKDLDAFFKKYTGTYPFNDAYIICEKHGHVMYSYIKKSDFGENLSTGALKDSALAKLWQKVRTEKRAAFQDMSAYAPNGDEPSMFIGAPVYVNKKLESILVLRIENSSINNIMSFRNGYGKTQEDYLVGFDKLMRSDSFLDSRNHSLEASFKNQELGKVDTMAVNNALQGKEETKTLKDYRGFEVLSSYSLIDIDRDFSWIMISEIDKEEVLKSAHELRDTIIIISVVAFLLVLLSLYFFIKNIIISPLESFQHDLLNFFKYLNRETNDVNLLKVDSNDEIGTMTKAINIGIEKTRDNILKNDEASWIKEGVNQLNEKIMNISDLVSVSKESLKFVATYLNAGVGVFYIFDEKEEKLQQFSSYAHVQRDELANTFKLGEGVVGQVALQKEPICLKNIRRDEGLITTGTLSQPPINTYTFPLIYRDTLYGVIEIGSFELFSKKDIEFFEAANKIIATTLSTAIQNDKVQQLLENTKEANQELEKNQQKLEEANARMEEQQQQLEEANARMEEQQQQLKLSEQNLKLQNQALEKTKEEIEQKAKELELSGKYKSEFLANMSHELRTPLNSIILLSSLLQKNSKQTLSNDDIKKAKTIFESGNELLRLINDILDLSKVESGKMQVIIDSFRSNDLLLQMKDLFEHSALDKGLDFNIIDKYNNAPIKSDKDRISQIVRNLISNALKFTKDGSITLEIAPSPKEDCDFSLSVKDTGIGIPEDKQDLIFKAFTQAEGGTSREYGGTGLGLSISKELAKLLGGYIRLESKENEGSSFIIDLPNLEEVENIPTPVEQKVEVKKEVSTKKHSPIALTFKDDRDLMNKNKEAFLIIDDDKTFCEIVYEEIKRSGNLGLVALDATSGLELVKKYNIKGIMLDLTLPDMDGVDVLKELKSNSFSKDIPVHIISSKDKNSETLELGAIGYLQKPVYDGDINNILTTIDDFKKKEIKDLLIVEDDEVHRDALIELIGEGVNIRGVETAKDAISEIKKEIYDTVVIDLGLIHGSGYEVCEYIKNSYPNLPIIIYTGKEIDEDEKRKLQEYSNSIIIKTANSNERILNEINLFLHRNEEIEEENNNDIFEDVDLSNLNILVVDDDIKNIFVLDAALKEYDASVVTAFNGQEAIDCLHNDPSIDIVLMDIMMPVMNGYEAMEIIRKDEKLKDIPIIAVTAKAMKDDREKCIRLGANDYLSKPIDMNILGKLIKVWSDKKAK